MFSRSFVSRVSRLDLEVEEESLTNFLVYSDSNLSLILDL